jgi:hypothetical protein
MTILFPPLGCKTAYIRDSAVLIVPEGASLAPLCVKCGKPPDVRVSKTFYWREWHPSKKRIVEQVLRLALSVLIRSMAFETPVSIEIPLCREHRSKQMRKCWSGVVLIVIGLGSLPFSYKATAFRTPLEMLNWGATLGSILLGLLLLFLGVHILWLTELNERYAGYTGFGIEYMQKIPSDTEIFSPRRTEVTSNSWPLKSL